MVGNYVRTVCNKHINSIAAGVNRAYNELESICQIIVDELTDDAKDSAHTYERMCTKAMDALGQSLIMLNLISSKLKKAESRLYESKLENRIKQLERLMRK